MIVELTTYIALGMFCLAADERQETPKEKPTEAAKQVERTDTKPELTGEEKALAELKLLPIELNIVTLTNAERKRRGLSELKIDPKLVKSARKHCSWMTRTRNLVHTKAPVGENIALGQRDSREAVKDWMSSQGHRANILNRSYKTIGTAAFRTPDGRIYWCEQFRF